MSVAPCLTCAGLGKFLTRFSRVIVVCWDCDGSGRLAQQPPQPLDRIHEPASHADGQQHGDDGEGV